MFEIENKQHCSSSEGVKMDSPVRPAAVKLARGLWHCDVGDRLTNLAKQQEQKQTG